MSIRSKGTLSQIVMEHIGRIKAIESLFRQLKDPSQRMTGLDPILDRVAREQRGRALVFTAHQGLIGQLIVAEVGGFFYQTRRSTQPLIRAS